MTLEEIKKAVESGKVVCWSNESYRVVKDKIGQWIITCYHGSTIGLTKQDGVTLNGQTEDFYILGS
jgi:ribosomal protein L30E